MPATLWSLAGTVLPLLAALVAVPWLLHRMGQERLGLLSLVWVVVGYFSFLDMGLGRAVTVAVARLRADPTPAHAGGGTNQADPPGANAQWQVLGSALAVLLGASALVALPLAVGVAWGPLPLRLSDGLAQTEVRQALGWTLPALPLLLLATALRGHLEGLGAFGVLNRLRIPTGIALAGAPCLTAAFSSDLRWACAALLVVRAVHAALAWRLLAQVSGLKALALARRCVAGVDAAQLRALLRYGGWVTVSNVVGPVIVYLDRFLIGGLMGAAAVAAYVVPFDVVSRLPVLVAALAGVLLPELARLAQQATDAQRARQLVGRATRYSVWVMVPVVLVAVLVAPWGLSLWLGEAFARDSARVTQILLVAFGLNALAQIPFAALQAMGRVRAVALLHLGEVLPYAAAVWWAVQAWGLQGAAWAWLARGALDYAALSVLLRRASAPAKPTRPT